MIESIGAQHVRRRQRASPSASFKPLDKIKQKPAHKKRARGKKKVSMFKQFSGLRPGTGLRLGLPSWLKLPKFFRKPVRKKAAPSAAPNIRPAAGRQAASPRQNPFASAFLRLITPALIVAAVSLFVLILYCSFAHTGTGGGAFITPGEDSGFQVNMASYAGLSPQAYRESGASPSSEDIPLDLKETFSWLNYTVKRGDSVSKIAAAFGISMDAIIASNGITNVRRLYQGQTIKIPNMDGIPYTVKAGDSLHKISSSMNVPLEAILDANDVQNENIIPGTVLFIPGAKMRAEDLKLALGELFIYPIRGRLTSPFGWRHDPISGVRRYHAAIDLAAPIGTPVKAAMDGRVSTVGYNGTYGKFIIVNHNNGFQTMYAHLSVTSVTQGSLVNQGTKIGEVGNTGYSTGPHLHFAVFKNGRAVNPRELLSS
jgi:murein DD-endopeptidase MepM/ murein hydrolase activator NlpD